MRTRTPLRRPLLTTVLGAMVLAALCASSAAAQARGAAIRVSATVRDAAHSNLIGATPEATDPRAESVVDVASASGSWRITSGRSGQIGLQVEAAETGSDTALVRYVTICDEAGDEPAHCRQHRAPFLRVNTEGESPEFVVRMGGASVGATADRPMRLTVAFIAY